MNLTILVVFAGFLVFEYNRDLKAVDPAEIRNRFTFAFATLLVVSFLFNYVFVGRISNVIFRIMSKLQRAAAQTVTTSAELSSASQSVAESSNEQASAVQETVASMAEMRSIISQTAKYVEDCQTLSSNVREKTQDGDRIMQSMVASMEAIQQTNSQLQNMVNIIGEISNKTKVINDIVFKTQLLSFNASIEAARAGQHGKGFAVVAEEVGNLAQMSGKAAKEIEVLLADSQKQVGGIIDSVHHRITEGQNVSSQALARFNEIATDIHGISEKIKNISNATKEQEAGIGQTSRAMDQMDLTTQRNNSAAVQASNYAKEIESQGEVLRDIMSESQLLILGHVEEMQNEEKQDEDLELRPSGSSLPGIQPDEESFELTPSHEPTPSNVTELSQVAQKLAKKVSSSQGIKKAAGEDEVSADDDSFKREN